MRCTCRASSLRIFVQSLTGLQISLSAFPRSAQLHVTPFAASQMRHRYLTRPFSAAATLCSTAEEGQKSSDVRTAEPATSEEGREDRQRPDNAPREEPANPAVISAPAADLERAKSAGVILDISPESLESLLVSHERNQQNRYRKPPSDKYTKRSDSRNSSSSNSNNTHPDKYKKSASAAADTKSDGSKPKPSKPHSSSSTSSSFSYSSSSSSSSSSGKYGKEHWRIQKEALKRKFPDGWAPRKRLSPAAVEGVRALNKQFPETYRTRALAEQFEVSPEAIRRILRTHWEPSPDEDEHREERWFNRGKNVWTQMAALGTKPPRRWRREGVVRDPSWNERKRGKPRTEYPFMPRWRSGIDDDAERAAARSARPEGQELGQEQEQEQVEEEGEGEKEELESPDRKLSENLV